MEKALKILKEQYDILSNDIDGVWIDPVKIDEAIEELESLQNRKCGNCIYGNKNMIKDKIVCDICVSINRKGIVDKTFYCNKWESK